MKEDLRQKLRFANDRPGVLGTRPFPPFEPGSDRQYGDGMAGPLRATIVAEDESATAELYHWLAEDIDLRPYTRVTAAVDPGSATLSTIDTVDVVLTHAEAVGGLVLTLVAFLRSRPPGERITVKRPDGSSITVDGASEDVIAGFLRAGTSAEVSPDSTATGSSHDGKAAERDHDDSPRAGGGGSAP
jgi:hypothetical protein